MVRQDTSHIVCVKCLFLSSHVQWLQNREYTYADFKLCVDSVRERVTDIVIATDIICGFPGESEAAHMNTLEFLNEYKIPIVNISQFYPRPNTPAAKWTRIPTDIVKRRSKEVTRTFESYTTWLGYVGGCFACHIHEFSEKSDHLVGHTDTYVKVLIPYRKLSSTVAHAEDHSGKMLTHAQATELLGSRVMVDVTAATKWHIEATIA